jgi:hypothetical protein
MWVPDRPMGVPHVGRNGQAVRLARNSSRFILYGAFAVAISVAAATATVVAQPSRGGPQPLLDLPARPRLAASYPLLAPDQKTLVQASFALPALLGQHSVLVADMTRGRLRSDPDLAQATNAAISKNTGELAGLVRALYGDSAATTFAQLWSGHVTAYFNYARGLSEMDAAVRQSALTAINKFETDIASFFSKASGGKLPQSVADQVVKIHLGHLLHQANEYSEGQYPEANNTYRAAYTQGFDLGKALDTALLPNTVQPTLKTPGWQLQSALDKLLGEHVVLMVSAMRSAATNNPDFTAAASAVDANTRDLGASIGTLFGAAAGQRFQSLWADHVDALISYSAAIAKGDTAQRDDARTKLSTFETRMTAFLAGTTRNRLAGTGLATALSKHDAMLTSQAASFVNKDYTASHDTAYTTYQNVISLAGQLAEAFRVTLGGRLPQGAPETGRGGMAAEPEQR